MPAPYKEGVKCELCNDVGYRHYWENGQELVEQCECFNQIQFSRNMKKSGANPNMTFDTFFMDHDYQKEKSMNLLNRLTNKKGCDILQIEWQGRTKTIWNQEVQK